VASDEAFVDRYASVCYNTNSANGSSAETWIIIIGIYNFGLLCFAAYHAYITRHVRFLLDSQSVGFAIYNLGIFSFSGMLLHFVLKDDPTAAFAAASIALFLSVGGILVLLMAPSIRRRNLTANEVRALISTRDVSPNQTAQTMGSSAYIVDSDAQATIAGLRARLRKLESENHDLRFRQGMQKLLEENGREASSETEQDTNSELDPFPSVSKQNAVAQA